MLNMSHLTTNKHFLISSIYLIFVSVLLLFYFINFVKKQFRDQVNISRHTIYCMTIPVRETMNYSMINECACACVCVYEYEWV